MSSHKNFRIDSEEEFKKAIEKIPDYKIKAEKVKMCFIEFVKLKQRGGMFHLNCPGGSDRNPVKVDKDED